jgi:hypothetical protein
LGPVKNRASGPRSNGSDWPPQISGMIPTRQASFLVCEADNRVPVDNVAA